ncbi:MAG: hypothetical protein IKD43_01105 [Clostridia bacterium]|nr:hypothetical protein [Clostridia bacterium]
MRTVKSMLKVMAVVILSLVCVLFAYALRRAPVFEEGIAYEFYRGTSSAEIVLSENPALTKLFAVDIRGESVRYAGDRYEEIAEEFKATLLFTESAAGITNYYLYTPMLERGVFLAGHEVNLHIAVGGGQTAAGTPLIFGGF